MRVLLTGGSGQVGTAIGQLLGGRDVVACSRAELDITDHDEVEVAVAEVRPDVVVNCAAVTDVDRCEREPELAYAVNALGVRHLAVAADRQRAHVVHVSTDYVFDGSARRPYLEWDATGPTSVYGRSKLGGERELAGHARSWAVVRTSWVFGRRGRDFVQLALDAAAGAEYGFVDDQIGSPTYAADLAGVLARLAVGRHRGVFHVANGGVCTRYEMARAVLELRGLDPGVLKVVSTADLGRPAPRPAYSALGGLALPGVGIARLRHYRDALAEYLREGG